MGGMARFSITELRRQRAGQLAQGRKRRVFRLFGLACTPLVLLCLLWAFSPLLRPVLERRVSDTFGLQASVSSFRFNPFRMSVQLGELSLRDAAGAELVGLGEGHINLELLPLLRRVVHFNSIELKGLRGRVLVLEEGRLELSDYLARLQGTSQKGQQGEGMGLVIEHLELMEARVTLEDRSLAEPFRLDLGPISFKLDDFEILPEASSDYHFVARTDRGEELSWEGTLSVSPLRSQGHFALSGIDVARYQPYLSAHVPYLLRKGLLDVSAEYLVRLESSGPLVKFSEGRLEARDVAVSLADRDPFAFVDQLSVQQLSLDSAQKKVSIGLVEVVGPKLLASRDRAGKLDFLQALNLQTSNDAMPGGGWLDGLRLERLDVKNGGLLLDDASGARPARYTLSELALEVKDLVFSGGSASTFQMGMRLNDSGQLRLRGDLDPRPLNLRLELGFDGVELAPFSPLLESHLRARLLHGTTTGALNIHVLGGPEKGTPALSTQGSLQVASLALVDQSKGLPLLGIDGLSVGGLHFASEGAALGIEELVLRSPRFSLSVDAAGKSNLEGLVPRANAAKSGVPITAPQIRLSSLVVDGGQFELSDASVSPLARLRVSNFGGRITGLDSGGAAAVVALGAKLEPAGRLALEGRLQPFGRQANAELRLSLDTLNLMPFSGYFGRYAGYSLAGGRLSLDVRTRLLERELDSENVATIDHFGFGAATGSPEATKLPVRLAVSLLKDAQGRIVLDLPVKGSLDDPEFKIGRVVWRLVGNLVSKAATSPFSLLAASVGSRAELSSLGFDPGDPTLVGESQGKVKTLLAALLARPEVSLGLTGFYDPEVDIPALKSRRLDEAVAAEIWRERSRTQREAQPVTQLPATEEECRAALVGMYRQMHPVFAPPPLVEVKSSVAKPAPVKSPRNKKLAADQAEHRGLLTRIYQFFRGGKKAAPAPTSEAPVVAPVGETNGTPAVADLDMEQVIVELEAAMPVSEAQLVELGLARSQAVERALLDGGIAPSRIRAAAPEQGGTHVQLSVQ